MPKQSREFVATSSLLENLERGLDERDAAAILSVKQRTLSDWRLRGCGPVYTKCGRRVTYRPADLRAYLAANRRTSTADDTVHQPAIA
jgi:phage terminase Nu1 subunit (DNA packaging protein)